MIFLFLNFSLFIHFFSFLDQVGASKVTHDQNGSEFMGNGNHKSKSTSAMDSVRSVSRNVFSKKQLYKKVPILDWLPKYDVQTGVSDLIAGITVGLTVIPQGIAYALIAKLPPQVGNPHNYFRKHVSELHDSS